MTEEGIGKMASDLSLDPQSDVRVLVLCWRMGAKKPSQIDSEEWESGAASLGVDSFDKLKDLIPSLDPTELDRYQFRNFYKFVFLFSREGTHRTIEREVVSALLPIAICDRAPDHLPYFLEFLETLPGTTRITLDQWCTFLEFADKVNIDLQGYEEDGAWPLLLDDYVDFLRQKQQEQ